MRVCKFSLFVIVLALFSILPVSAKDVLMIKGECLTPSGRSISLDWQVESEANCCHFFLLGREKAQMFLKNGKVVKIRRLVRFQGKEKWIVLREPLQISIELRSGFYPFSAVLNFRKKGERHTKVTTGIFEVTGGIAE